MQSFLWLLLLCWLIPNWRSTFIVAFWLFYIEPRMRELRERDMNFDGNRAFVN